MADIVKTETQNLPAEINGGFNTAMKIAEELAKSDIIPKEFQKKCRLIA